MYYVSADFSSSVNHEKHLVSMCLKNLNLDFKNFDLRGCSPVASPHLFVHLSYRPSFIVTFGSSVC